MIFVLFFCFSKHGKKKLLYIEDQEKYNIQTIMLSNLWHGSNGIAVIVR